MDDSYISSVFEINSSLRQPYSDILKEERDHLSWLQMVVESITDGKFQDLKVL